MLSQPNIYTAEAFREVLLGLFSKDTVVPVVGAGISCNLPTERGSIPDGSQYREHMLSALEKSSQFTEEELNSLKLESFSNLCGYYEDDDIVKSSEVLSYMRNNFHHASFKEDPRLKLFDIDWPYVYSLNIDDAIENSSRYNHVILHYRDVREDVFSDRACLIKLHGDINDLLTYKGSKKVFTSKEYAISLNEDNKILQKLRNDFAYQNVLFIGCSLNDEFDLMSLSSLPVDYSAKEEFRKNIVFIKGAVNKLKLSKYKQYGITDIVCFEEYSEMYDFLLSVWNDSKKVTKGSLKEYSRYSIKSLPPTLVKENQDYFLWGKSLIDNKLREITIPFYYISRSLSRELLSNLKNNNVHIIQGNHVSGKTYLLADIYRNVLDRETFLFDGRTRLSDEAFDILLSRENIIAMFDIGSLNRRQFEDILQRAREIHKNQSNFIILVNRNDSDSLGLVKWKLRQGYINSDDIIQYQVDNKLTNSGSVKEIDAINQLLPILTLPSFKKNHTFLDEILFAESALRKRGRYSNLHISVRNEKQLALLIMLAIKEKVYSSDIVKFSLEDESYEARKKYAPIIDKEESEDFEVDANDLSSVKIVLNSKFWLQRELGSFAKKSNQNLIIEAYKYIIKKIIGFSSKNDEIKKRYTCRDYILFDVMNDVFLNEDKGNITLIVKIYKELHGLLATDLNFMHQEAKCHLNYSYIVKDADEKRKILQTARDLSIVAESMAESAYEQNQNERLLISLSHIRYTIATILCQICIVSDYSDIKCVEEAIDALYLSLESPYNIDDYRRDLQKRTSYGIKQFVNNAVCISSLGISEDHIGKLTEILNNNYRKW